MISELIVISIISFIGHVSQRLQIWGWRNKQISWNARTHDDVAMTFEDCLQQINHL